MDCVPACLLFAATVNENQVAEEPDTNGCLTPLVSGGLLRAIAQRRNVIMTDERRGPLQDLTVIDCTMALAGPYGASLLADLGARVIKVEPPRGDGYRNIPPFLPDHASPYEDREAGTDFGAPFAAVNRNKRSVCLDLKDPAHKEVFLLLCDQADALVENMRAGVMDGMGLGYEVISARNPKLVCAAASRQGQLAYGLSPVRGSPKPRTQA